MFFKVFKFVLSDSSALCLHILTNQIFIIHPPYPFVCNMMCGIHGTLTPNIKGKTLHRCVKIILLS